MNRVYIPYWEWEDYHAGMWRSVDKQQEAELLKVAISFTGDHVKYGLAMSEVINVWPKTMTNSLTNPSINRRAFLGHCACQYKMNLPEYIVRMAWKELTEIQQDLANNQADINIKRWEIRYYNTSTTGEKDVTKMGYQMKLPLK